MVDSNEIFVDSNKIMLEKKLIISTFKKYQYNLKMSGQESKQFATMVSNFQKWSQKCLLTVPHKM